MSPPIVFFPSSSVAASPAKGSYSSGYSLSPARDPLVFASVQEYYFSTGGWVDGRGRGGGGGAIDKCII